MGNLLGDKRENGYSGGMSSENILVRMPNWVGDVVMATPVLADLRRAFPKANITAMCQAPVCELLEQDPSIDELFCFSRLTNEFARRRERRDLVAKLRAGKYEAGILLTNSFSSAWWFWQGNVKRRIGFAGDLRSWLLTDALPYPAKEHQIATYKRLLAPLHISPSSTMPRLYVSSEEVAEVKQLLQQRGAVAGRPLIGLNPGAAFGSAKCWPPERFRELAERLLKQGKQVVLFGDVASRDWIHAIAPVGAINLAGLTTLRELVCAISLCDVLVTNDSGPMHIASAMGTSLVALFGSTDQTVTGPYGQKQTVIDKKVSCSPCLKRTCPIDFRCMRQITVDEVLRCLEP